MMKSINYVLIQRMTKKLSSEVEKKPSEPLRQQWNIPPN